MYKILFVILAASGLLSMAAYMVMLYGKDTYLITFTKHIDMVMTPVKGFWKNWNETTDNTTVFAWTSTTANTATTQVQVLPACPDKPPDLVGPLRIEFNFKVNLDDLRRKFSGTLHEGGRYKPPDCISKQKVAIIIPFRKRYEHLGYWLFYLHDILLRQQLDYGVFIINQDGEGVFNRAKLLNVGYMEALKTYDYDCFVFSDVDLVPLDDRNLYRCFDNPRHLAVAMDKFNFGLPYNTYYGGVSSLSKNQYMKINGFPNTFWGWGGEDDDIYKRIVFRGMSISRPDMLIGKYRMIRHNRDLHNEPNPKNPDKLHHTRRTMDSDGLNSLKYTVKKIEKDLLYTLITVDIAAPLK